MEMIQQYFEKHVPVLEQWVKKDLDPLSFVDSNELKNHLAAATKEWNEIPLEEKQIPYLPIESVFWSVFGALSLFSAAEIPIETKRKVLPDFEIIKRCFMNREPLPEIFGDARRPLP